MAGPAKKRAQGEKQAPGAVSSDTQPSSGDRSTPKSIPRMDGNRDPGIPEGKAPMEYSNEKDLKNIGSALGLAGWCVANGYKIPEALPMRPAKFNTNGREATITLNTYNVAQAPNARVYQYDIAWGSNTDFSKRVLLKKIWNSKAVKDALGEPAERWIYDGNKLAWSARKLDREETRVEVDLDAEENRTSKVNTGKNKHTIFIRATRKVDFSGLAAFLSGKANWSPECIDTINFLDHVMRENPSRKYTQIKKSFFQRGEARFDLGGGVEAFKGVFSSLRPVLNDKRVEGLSINVDVANGTFWRTQELLRSCCQVFNCDPPRFINMVKSSNASGWKTSVMKRDLGRFKRVGVTDFHNKNQPGKQWTIKEILPKDAHEAQFADPDNEGKMISVYNYYKNKYNIMLKTGLPVVEVTKQIRKKPVYLPMEYLKIDDNQRYNTKLSDTQTSQMIKFAVTLPGERRKAIEFGVKLLDWANDPYLKHYGIKVNPTPSTVKARVLPPPKVGFGPLNQPTLIPERDLVQGRWRLDGKKFIGPNTRELTAWGVVVIKGRSALGKDAVDAFTNNFLKIYAGHGGKISAIGQKPFVTQGDLADGGEMVAKTHHACGNHFKLRPMFMMYIVHDRNVETYRRIKKSCDLRFGIPSQVLQAKHVMNNQPQYISNVCMKVNAKLGGCTTMTASTVLPKVAPNSKNIPTMIIGADVSHPAPGAGSDEKASFAAITMSCDTTFTKYWAQCNTNGSRVEMVTTQNINDHVGDMAKTWMMKVGKGMPPKRVLYIRDGVSEGQYAAVLQEEVRDMKAAFNRLGVKDLPKFTVVIAGKRHHIRFFPQQGDRNGNPIPGTLVESGCTHPFEFDFYLCSHVAIKGTARPIHYQVILNECDYGADELQQLLFEHSYQYVRSTTPVSLHPAVYYAHLAADRSRAHVNESPVSSGKKEAKAAPAPDKQSSTGLSSDKKPIIIKPLMAMTGGLALKETMWFV